jgi:hypothetical protein
MVAISSYFLIFDLAVIPKFACNSKPPSCDLALRQCDTLSLSSPVMYAGTLEGFNQEEDKRRRG